MADKTFWDNLEKEHKIIHSLSENNLLKELMNTGKLIPIYFSYGQIVDIVTALEFWINEGMQKELNNYEKEEHVQTKEELQKDINNLIKLHERIQDYQQYMFEQTQTEREMKKRRFKK